jgi:hypothetical protein
MNFISVCECCYQTQNLYYTATCTWIAREWVTNISVQMGSWKPTRYGTHILGYEHERCFHGDIFLEITTSLWNQQAFPWILIRYITGRSVQNEVGRTRVEAGSNTSAVALRNVRGDEMKCLGTESKIWLRVPRDSDPRKSALARTSCIYTDRPVLLLERAPHKTRTVTVRQ